MDFWPLMPHDDDDFICFKLCLQPSLRHSSYSLWWLVRFEDKPCFKNLPLGRIFFFHFEHERLKIASPNLTTFDKREALHFFCSKAFKRDVPEEGYLEMSHEVVKYTGGLPLALKVLGSYLYGRNVSAWHSAVKKLRSVPDAKILETLRISYDGLDSMQKEIFLDIACFFKGKPKDKVLDLFEKRGYNPQIEIDVLIERSLVTVKQDIDVFKKKFDVLEMHDLLQEMGRSFVIQESPNYPSKRSRLWSPEDLDLMLTQNKGTETIQSIVLPPIGNGTYYVQRWRDKAIPNMSQLKFLNFDFLRAHIHINIPSTLKVLHWELCPLETLPLVDQRYELVEIKISWSNIVQLWHGFKFLEKLKHLDLSCSGLEQTPDLSGVPVLETLDLSCCHCLTLIHPSLICHKSLLVLNLWECTSLETFPGKLEMSLLKELNLCDCKSFMSPPEFGECMTKLSRLYFQDMTISELPISLGSLVGLSELDLRGCKKLTCLPDSIHELESLRILRASWCSSLCDLPHSVSVIPFLSILDLRDCCLTEESFPCDFGQFPSLTDLDLSGNHFVNLPISIHELPKLKCLSLNGCKRLQSLPELPSSIRELKAWCCDSLDTRSFNNLSKACSVFASTSQGPGEVLQMVIPGANIPSWLVHRQESNCLSVPFPHHCHPSERLGIALYFIVRPSERWFSSSLRLAVGNGDRVITSSIPIWYHQGYHLCMFCMTNDCLSDQETRKAIHFELSFEYINVEYPPEILSSAACWVHTDEIEHLNKGETERPNKKRQKMLEEKH
ncbi:TMV resistance protein N [Arachis hypogaea]|nr:TMV resistance protein N [Arachis hypogaea]